MLISGDVVELDLGHPAGSEAGFRRPAVIITAQRILDATPAVIHVVPLSSRVRDYSSEIVIDPDADNGLDRRSAAQCQHLRAVSANRVNQVTGIVGPATLAQIRDVVGLLIDIPA